MAFDERFKEELKARVDLAAIIGERVTLNRKGNKYTGLCPFHNDHNPSMNVDPVRGFFKCFSCGKGGDVFTFLMDYDHLSFPEAVKLLAERYGIPLPEEHERTIQRADHSLPLKDMNAYAARIFHEYLMRHQGAKQARLYLKSRGIGKATAERFQLGYAPAEFRFLEPFLKAKGFDPRLFPDTGLFFFKDGRALDFFRGRLMFPIRNERGDVLGFGGRVLGTGEPKYLNTGETPLFRKKTILYGLHSAMKDLAKSRTIFVCEGYLDVIACQESGLPAVAPLGTALTEEQLVKLKRWGDTLVLFFDADGAGLRAAERAAVLCIEMALKAEVLTIPDGKDPFEYRHVHGGEALHAVAQQERADVYTFLLDKRIPKRLLSPAEKSDLAKDFAALLVRIKDAAVMADYKNRIAAALGLEASHFDHIAKAPPPKRQAPPPVYENDRLTKVERDFVLMLCDNPQHIATAAALIRPEHLTDKAAAFIYRTLLTVRGKENLSFADILDLFPQATVRDWIERKILGSELFRSFRPPPHPEKGQAPDPKEQGKALERQEAARKTVDQALGDYLKKLKREILSRQKVEVDTHLAEAMAQQDEAALMKWQEERLRLSTELQALRQDPEAPPPLSPAPSP